MTDVLALVPDVETPADAPEVERATPPRAPEPKPRLTRADVPVILFRGLLLFGVLVLGFLVFLRVFSGFEHERDQAGLERTFRTELGSAQAPIGGAIAPGKPVALLRVPALGGRQVVVEGSTASITRSGPGHVRATPLPGQRGNSVLIGRHSTYGAPFGDLRGLHRGDRVDVLTGQGKSRYRIERVFTTAAADRTVLRGGGASQLTLVTSDATFGNRWLVARARLVTKPKAATPHAASLARAELGVSGEPVSLYPLIGWLQVLLLVSVLAVFVLRRYRRWSAYLVTIPVVLAVLWPLYDELARHLAATL